MGSGSNAKNVLQGTSALSALQNQGNIVNDPRVAQALMGYSSGGSSLQDTLKSLSGVGNSQAQDRVKKLREQKAILESLPGIAKLGGWENWEANEDNAELGLTKGQKLSEALNQAEQDANQNYGRMAMNQLFTDPLTGTKVATEQVQTNPLLSGMFGKGGMQDRLFDEEKNLASRGWSMQPEDYEAYGQASGDISRMAGQEEQSLMNALAQRGLAAAPSGAAGVGFSGIQGNKFERLAAAQRKIADDRMKMNFERLNSTRSMAMQSNQLAQRAIGDQYSRNTEGVNSYQQSLKDAVSAAQMAQGQENAAFQQQQATKGPGFGDILGAAAGMGLGALTGGAGTSLGAGLGKALGGSDLYAPKK